MPTVGTPRNFPAPLEFHEPGPETNVFVPAAGGVRIEEFARQISPATRVSGGDPPTLIAHGVKSPLMPPLSDVTSGRGGYPGWELGRVEVGAFLGDLANFLIPALGMFVLTVEVPGAVQKVAKLTKLDEPVVKEYAYCLSTIPAKAVRCARRTSDPPPERTVSVDGSGWHLVDGARPSPVPDILNRRRDWPPSSAATPHRPH